MIRRRTFIASAAASLAVPLAARPARAQAVAVRMATSPAESYAEPFYAKEAGIFAKNGIDAQIQLLGTGAAVSAALAGGSIDVGIGTIVSIASAIERGVPFVMIAPAQLTTPAAPTALLCVEKNSTIQTPKDFEGKTVAVPALKQIVDLVMLAWMEKGGADPNKVQLIEVHFSDMGPGLDRGTFAGAIIADPSLTYALAKNNIRALANPFLALAPEFTGAGWITTKSYQQKNGETVRRVADSLLEAAHWANTHHPESAEIVSKITKVPVTAIEHEKRTIYCESMKNANLQVQLDAALKYGYINRPITEAQLLGQA